jgi:hypothetical protein
MFLDYLVIIGHEKGGSEAPCDSSSTVPKDRMDLSFDVLSHINMLLPHNRIL